MTLLGILIVVLALLTAFAMGVITGEEVARQDYIVKTWEDEEDGGIEEQDPVTD